MHVKPARFAVLASALMLALGACSATPEEEPSQAEDVESEDSSPAADREAEDAEQQMDAAAGPGAEEIEYDGTLDVIATREAAFGAIEVELELNSVRVSGELMNVLFTVTNIGGGKWHITQDFDSGERSLPPSDPGEPEEDREDLEDTQLHTTDGVTVTDDANGMVHRAAYDRAGNCLCSSGLAGSFVEEGNSVLLSTRFAAPPEGVDTVTVEIPHFGTFDDVPLSR